jgi:glycosyltransferase involved in cell wall biosynthesis
MLGPVPVSPTDRDGPLRSPRKVRRLRVLHLVRFLSVAGGAERFALGLTTNLPADRFECWVCVTRGGDAAPIEKLARAGIPYVDLGRRTRWDIHHMAGLAALLRRGQFDVLHSHSFGMNFWGTTMGYGFGVPVLIAHEPSWSYEGNRVRKWLDGRVIGRLATRFVAVSSADAERMVRLEHVPPQKPIVIPNAYIPHDDGIGVDLRTELGLPPDTPLVGTAAEFRPEKALEVLIDAHALCLTRVPNAHLVLAGDGPMRGQLERRVADRGLADRAHFLGRRQDVDAILRSLDVAAMSSDNEGTPLFAYECIANRTPLVATDVGGLPDIIDNGRTGILVERRRPDQLSDALAELLVDADRRARLAEAAYEQLDRFRIQAIALRFADLYEAYAPVR